MAFFLIALFMGRGRLMMLPAKCAAHSYCRVSHEAIASILPFADSCRSPAYGSCEFSRHAYISMRFSRFAIAGCYRSV